MSVDNFFTFLEMHYKGIFLFLFALYFVVFLIERLAKIFNWGKYGRRKEDCHDPKSSFTYIIAEFFVNIINDFRHLLALAIVLIFFCLIIYVTFVGENFEQKKEGIQLVLTSLGGLIAAIIGYYFGESAAMKSNTAYLSGDVKPSTKPVNNNEENTPAITEIEPPENLPR